VGACEGIFGGSVGNGPEAMLLARGIEGAAFAESDERAKPHQADVRWRSQCSGTSRELCFGRQKTHVEAGVVGADQGALQCENDVAEKLTEAWSSQDVFVGYPMDTGAEDGSFGVDERIEHELWQATGIHAGDGDFDDSGAALCGQAGGFEVDDGEWYVAQRLI
jgi:hypothetical protein